MATGTLEKLGEELQQKRGELAKLFEDVKGEDGKLNATSAQVAEIRRRNDELTELGKKWEVEHSKAGADELEEIRRLNDEEREKLSKTRLPGGYPAGSQESRRERREEIPGLQKHRDIKSLGQLFTETAEYKGFRDNGCKVRSGSAIGAEIEEYAGRNLYYDPESKTLFETTAGWAPFEPRIPRVVLSAQRRPMVADLIPQDTTTAPAIRYMEETTFTNNAAFVAEGGAKPESALAFTEQTATVKKIATWLPATDEQLSDVPQVRAIIDNRLTLMLQLEEEDDLINANETGFKGFLNVTGLQTQALGSDPVPDAFYKAIIKVMHTGYADPSGIIMHPNDWQDVRLLRTNDGIYIWGNPADPGPERMWGLPVVVTKAMTENTGLVGAFASMSQIWRRQGITIEMTNSHDTYFIYNKIAIRAEERLALVVYRGAGFCKVTGI